MLSAPAVGPLRLAAGPGMRPAKTATAVPIDQAASCWRGMMLIPYRKTRTADTLDIHEHTRTSHSTQAAQVQLEYPWDFLEKKNPMPILLHAPQSRPCSPRPFARSLHRTDLMARSGIHSHTRKGLVRRKRSTPKKQKDNPTTQCECTKNSISNTQIRQPGIARA
ncbi:hypothetical protein BR93DRAFT_221380 [Coniochaeta sp. PMI_546]|nr:hypothetical protein BR93DRAFT_221380 [Coniochaeta sp. PMI_546]